MHIPSEEHIEALIERATRLSIHLYQQKLSQSRRPEYAKGVLVDDLKFNFAYRFPKDSLTHFVGSQLNHAWLMGRSLRQAVNDLPKQVALIEELATQILHEGGSPLLGKDDAAYRRCVKLFVRYHTMQNLWEYINDHSKEKPSLENSPAPAQKPLKAMVSRSKNDGRTKLSRDETLTLFKLLREYKFILKDEYLDKTLASEAIHALTGYSSKTLRQGFSDPYYYSDNLKSVVSMLRFLANKVDNKIDTNQQGDVSLYKNSKTASNSHERSDFHDPNRTIN